MIIGDHSERVLGIYISVWQVLVKPWREMGNALLPRAQSAMNWYLGIDEPSVRTVAQMAATHEKQMLALIEAQSLSLIKKKMDGKG